MAPISFFTCRVHVARAETSAKFINEARIKMIAGDDDNGSASMRCEKFAPFGGPDGGDGGRDDSVWTVADHNINALIDYRFAKEHLTCNGENGQGADYYGAAGEDITLRMPVGTAIYDADTEELITDLTVDGQHLYLAQGDEGSWDNTHFKSSTNCAPCQKTDGKAGERRNLRLELKVLTDVGLLGMPNAGKLTLITTISSTRLEIADYPSTTLHPNLEVVRTGPSKSLVVTGIPGLIEGVAEGAGLGHQSLRRLQHTRVLLHMADLAPFDKSVNPVAEARAIVGELGKYDAEFFDELRWLVLNKFDVVPEDECEARVKDFMKRFKWKGPVHRISALTHDGTQALAHTVQEYLDELRAEEDAAATAPDQRLDPGLRNVGHDDQVQAQQASLGDTPTMALYSLITDARRLVIKVGSSLVTNDDRGLDQTAIARWVAQITALRVAGEKVVLVSSGAITESVQRLGWAKHPKEVHELQIATVVGQMGLAQVYEFEFARHSIRTVQVLLMHSGLADRGRYLSAHSTLLTLLSLDVVPIINGNDTVVINEIKFGDNGTLGVLVTNLIEGDALIILTDQRGLYTADPRKESGARFVGGAQAGTPDLERMAGGAGSSTGKGGILTKILAAKRATKSGAHAIITPGRGADVLARLASGEAIDTQLHASTGWTATRKQWMINHLQLHGRVVFGADAVEKLTIGGKSLLPVSVAEVQGEFTRGEVISCVDVAGREVARGLTNYSSAEVQLVARKASSEIETVLGYVSAAELMHRSNLMLL